MREQICPYPGLRPFSEDESLFFKGRDTHIREIIEQLEERKIVVITGSSGDGKSSLVYAGVIPNARAGFFNAQYANWVTTSFMPERSPLTNLARTLSRNLSLDYDYVKKELGLGFSAIVSLYKSTSYYIDEQSEEWKNASEQKRKEKKDNAANLFILADQFEEFFTNPENYSNGKASAEAYTVVNLLLETTRIAIRENLPIYVVFTMRSDFISQSVAFKGLPEAIGYSQFFVPRLQRNELQQVIEEPALLAGGQITKRLTELLINELGEGFDQLPLLQHTLNRLWKQVNDGEADIDLVHLAQIGGLSPQLLPERDKETFNQWWEELSPANKKYLNNPAFTNVLNAHANFLYDNAHKYYMEHTTWADRKITEDDAKHIVKVAFQTLTKIDQGRAVRNRVTLQEITRIINRPGIKLEDVCGVLNIFRLQDSTFIRPFIDSSDIASQYLSGDTSLEITHESLIRNWKLLHEWDEEEYNNYLNFLDFNTQLNRWLENNKSDNYLLPAGPLSHFEEWYQSCNPNKYWIAKYEEQEPDLEKKYEKAEEKFINTREFLKSSRTFLQEKERRKKRQRRAAFILAFLIIIALSGLSYWAMEQKSRAEEQKKLTQKQKQIAQKQRDKAIAANKEAEKERKRAEQKAQVALKAKRQSDSAKQEALRLRKIAQRQKNKTKREAEKALKQKKIAERQKQLAQKQRKKAEAASDSAQTLTYLALAQSLSFKSQTEYDDQQINLLLALQSYKFNKNHGGESHNPSVFEALRNAWEITGHSNVKDIPANDVIRSKLTQNGKIIIIDEAGSLFQFPVNTEKTPKPAKKINTPVPINDAHFISNEMVVLSYEDRSMRLWNFKTNKSIWFGRDLGYIRAALLGKENAMFITAGREKTIRLWKVDFNTITEIKNLHINSRITGLEWYKGNNVLISCNSGKIITWNPETEKKSTLVTDDSRALDVTFSKKSGLIAASYSDGTVKLIDTNNGNKIKTIYAGSAGINHLNINDKQNILALADWGGRIRLYALDKLDESPIVIDDHRRIMYNIHFFEDEIYALCRDNTLRYWYTEIKNYARKVKENINRNFTKQEWKTFVGKNIDYKKTINNLK